MVHVNKVIENNLKLLSEQLCKENLLSEIDRAQIIQSLIPLKKHLIAQDIIQKNVELLLKQKNKQWIFGSGSTYITFNVLTALYLADNNIVDGDVLAKIIYFLTHIEYDEGGPYKSWAEHNQSNKISNSVDVLVNSEIAYFLALQEVDLPNITTLIEDHIKSNSFQSDFSTSKNFTIFSISRWYEGELKEKLITSIQSNQRSDGSWGDIFETCLAVLALLQLGVDKRLLQKAFTYLHNYDEKDGKLPFLTRALYISTLYEMQPEVKIPGVQIVDKSKDIHASVIRNVEQRFLSINSDLHQKLKVMIDKVLSFDRHNQVTLLPYYFSSILRKNTISRDMFIKLGEANLYGWIAYTIYDDFLDEEGNSSLLPVATISLRELTSIFNHILPGNSTFIDYFSHIMDQLDAANGWEVTYCRFPVEKEIDLSAIQLPEYGHYERIAHKSLGHALGPIAILFALGYDEKSQDIKELESFFKHYLIARQLDDDAHDWEQDIRRGFLNPVITLLLKRYRELHPATGAINMVILVEELRELFWYEVVEHLCNEILHHVEFARISLKKMSCVKDTGLFERLLEKSEKSAHQALNERKKTLDFLKGYSK